MQVRFNPPSARAPSAKPVPRLVVAKIAPVPPWAAPAVPMPAPMAANAGPMVVLVTREQHAKGSFDGVVLRAPSDFSASDENRVGVYLRDRLIENFEDFSGVVVLENDS